MPLQEGGDRSGDNLGVVEVDMMRSRHRPVFVEGVGAIRLHCRPVQLLRVPPLGLGLHRDDIRDGRIWQFGMVCLGMV